MLFLSIYTQVFQAYTFTYSPLFDLASSLVSSQLKRNFCWSHMTAKVTIKKLNDFWISSMLFFKHIQMNSRLRGKLVHLSNSQAQGLLPPNPSPCPVQRISSKHIYLFCLCLLFSTEPYFFKIDDHISMLLSLFVHNSLEGLDLLIELSNLWPTTVKSAHA